MSTSKKHGVEIGRFILKEVIPAGMSVTEAAKRLGVSRQALSKLLNGKATLSQEMALRLEKTFGTARERLLGLKATSERDRRRDEDRAVPVGAYVPNFLTIKAEQIETWTGMIMARDHLPVLLRGLLHSTGRELRRVDFPGFDNAQRHGWDGWVEAAAATPWVPAGCSGWECSVARPPQAKAERDYCARLKMLTPAERADCTFVFVTACNWPAKNEWAEAKDRLDDWKAVRAYDASDLEQWLETAVASRIWLADKLRLPTTGFQTLDRCWDDWAGACEPRMTAAVFTPSIDRHRRAFREWLMAPPNRPFTVAADSKEEAGAFIACLLRQDDVPAGSFDQAVLFDAADSLRLLAPSSSQFIPIVCSEETERWIGELYRRRHCIVVRPRNAVDRKPDIATELLSRGAFKKALAEMGITERERVNRLARESGRSPTILRRRLSKVDAVRTPTWARESDMARFLIPMTLVGAWHAGSRADREILEALAGRPYQDLEDGIAPLLGDDDCPVWCVQQYRGVVSKIDALFGVAPTMTKKRIVDFVDFAEYVLSESDPRLDLSPDRRWMAGIYGKVREHSEALRTGVCETLVLLAVHGDSLFRERLGICVAAEVNSLIQRLLTPLTTRKLLTHDRDLPNYAEAAPDQFLALLEEDLKRPDPALRTLLKPVGAGIFDSPMRTGILWALERVAWSPQYLVRVVLVLADLSCTKIDDNWGNKPINSLAAIFRWWVPQTAAPIDERIGALEILCDRFPNVGWQICTQQFQSHPLGAFNERPRWRNDGAGAGEPLSGDEPSRFVRKALDLAIRWPKHDETTLGELIESLGRMPDQDRLSVFDLIDKWSQTETDERVRADLRERIRCAVRTRHGRQLGLKGTVKARADEVYEKLAPLDPVTRHAWLFARSRVEPAIEDEGDENRTWEERQRRIEERRTEAMAEIWSERGLDGAVALLSVSNAEWLVGHCAARFAADVRSAEDVLRGCLSTAVAPAEKIDRFIRGFIESISENVRAEVLSRSAGLDDLEEVARLFRCAPFGEQTWRLLDKQARGVRDRYWRDVVPDIARGGEEETTELVDRLLEVDRPRAAFFAVQINWDKVETSRLKRLLWSVVTVRSEPDDHSKIDPYDLSEALTSLGGRPGVTQEEMAQIEFAFIEALGDSDHGIPNLEKRIAKSPPLFVQVLALAFKRSDGGQDPPAWRGDDPSRNVVLATAAYELLQRVKRIPGTDDEGQVDVDALMQWVAEARGQCSEHGRIEIGDEQIGQWLSRAASADDTHWPCRPVCDVLEAIGSNEMANGFAIGTYNGRGVTRRGAYEGGGQERDLVAQYRAWAQARRFEYPFVGRILDAIADDYEEDAAREDTEVRVRQRLE